MTIETLEQYRGIMSEIKALELEIDALYDPRKSPNGRQQSGGSGSTPSDPTGKNAMRIVELREKLSVKLDEWAQAAAATEQWLDTVDDAEIRAIIRWRYLHGCGWKATAKRVYGDATAADACRKRIRRFFQRGE